MSSDQGLQTEVARGRGLRAMEGRELSRLVMLVLSIICARRWVLSARAGGETVRGGVSTGELGGDG